MSHLSRSAAEAKISWNGLNRSQTSSGNRFVCPGLTARAGRSEFTRSARKSKGYDGELHQIYITGNGKIKPAIIITNTFEASAEEIVRKYSRRWLIEKEMSEQIEFFHLNRNSSGMVIKVDFDLTMSILAHNLYRLFTLQLDGYTHCADQTIFEKFIQNAGEIIIADESIEVRLKKKRNLPLLLEQMNDLGSVKLSWLNHLNLRFVASTTT